ncbi:MAG: hypothetical protein LBD96_04130 [Treponema sp.]|jgi:hypothetical protein|nr:hypothetical protein [Treponema sp.]
MNYNINLKELAARESEKVEWKENGDDRGFPKTSVFGKATLDLEEKADFWPLFPKLFPKLTEFWE